METEPYSDQRTGPSASLSVRFEVFVVVKLNIVEFTVAVFGVELQHTGPILYPEDGCSVFLSKHWYLPQD
jgi:hypothetical protein